MVKIDNMRNNRNRVLKILNKNEVINFSFFLYCVYFLLKIKKILCVNMEIFSVILLST